MLILAVTGFDADPDQVTETLGFKPTSVGMSVPSCPPLNREQQIYPDRTEVKAELHLGANIQPSERWTTTCATWRSNRRLFVWKHTTKLANVAKRNEAMTRFDVSLR